MEQFFHLKRVLRNNWQPVENFPAEMKFHWQTQHAETQVFCLKHNILNSSTSAEQHDVDNDLESC